MARIPRGEVRWADLGPVRGHEQAGRRPVLVISQDVFNERSGTAIVVAITSRPQRAGFPLSLELDPDLMPMRSWVKMGQVRSLPTERLGRRLCSLDPETLERVLEGLAEIVGR